jgi:hypothetical protein
VRASWLGAEPRDRERSMSFRLFSYAAAEQLLAFDQVSAECLCSNSYCIHFQLSDCLPRFLTELPYITSEISLIFAISTLTQYFSFAG